MNMKNVDLGTAMLQRGRQATAAPVVPQPASEMPMVLTLDQLRPNPDNPRTSRNPKFDDIKASILARGLDTVPKVTRDPDGEAVYIFSDGGNTRYQILTELWQETGEDRFYRLHCLFKPWPGRLQCVIGHLAENEVRGELSFIEKARGIQKARAIYEDQRGKKVSLRELASLLTGEGFPVHNSSISRMDDAVRYLYPSMPRLLESGLGAPQIRILLALRQDAENAWNQYKTSADSSPGQSFGDVFGACCHKFDSPELWSAEMFRDELIGDLLQALPHPALNYDRWLLELNPKERHRRNVLGDTSPLPELADVPPAQYVPPRPAGNPQNNDCDMPPLTSAQEKSGDGQNILMQAQEAQPSRVGKGMPSPVPEKGAPDVSPCVHPLRPELQPDMYGGAPVLSGDVSEEDIADMLSGADIPPSPEQPIAGTLDFATVGLEPVGNIWHISPLHDDIEHLQAMAFRLAFELAESRGCEAGIMPDAAHPRAAGYSPAPSTDVSVFGAQLLSLVDPAHEAHTLALACLLTGTSEPACGPMLDDVCTVKFLRLIRVLRRLRELQRGLPVGDDVADTEGGNA
ncbi:ParB family protein [Cedecea sp. NFIX57]|uniref:ParB family protein n=1 Tax=Cedecea sp. NFIX57 TaxID=1566286 RepID=UPI000A0C807C|nr:ParB family protein [Cedecea sp. NFIX57]SMG55521.1 integrating conjugative element, PFGI_1 class, ParB family protein [Cedecea sp. NFIX57]